MVVQGDVSSGAAVSALVGAACSQLGGIHILVNNAGISADHLTVRLSEDEWDRVLDTDLKERS
jgi:3-oxoacyl-[acyl-carrier protein] reductase